MYNKEKRKEYNKKQYEKLVSSLDPLKKKAFQQKKSEQGKIRYWKKRGQIFKTPQEREEFLKKKKQQRHIDFVKRVKEYASSYNRSMVGKLSSRKSSLKRNYNLSIEQFEEIKEAQSGRCAICFDLFKDTRNCHVDHDHGTGKVRGLLCSNCNRGLGVFYDDIEMLKSAIYYLEKYDT